MGIFQHIRFCSMLALLSLITVCGPKLPDGSTINPSQNDDQDEQDNQQNQNTADTTTPGHLEVNADQQLTLHCYPGASTSTSLTIRNTGGATFSFRSTVTDSTGGNRLTLTPASGELTGGSHVVSTLSASCAGRDSGAFYTGAVTIIADNVLGSPKSVDVRVEVSSTFTPPEIALALSTSNLDCASGVLSSTLTIRNTGQIELQWGSNITYANGDPAWLSMGTSQGTVAAGGAVDVSLSGSCPAGLPGGNHSATVEIRNTNSNYTVIPRTVAINLSVPNATAVFVAPAIGTIGTPEADDSTFQKRSNGSVTRLTDEQVLYVGKTIMTLPIDNRAFLSFDLPGINPSTITYAKLSFVVQASAAGAPARTTVFYGIDDAWGTLGANAWDLDATGTIVGQHLFEALNPPHTASVEIDTVDLLTYIRGGGSSFLIKNLVPGIAALLFRASENDTVADRPTLTVRYTVP